MITTEQLTRHFRQKGPDGATKVEAVKGIDLRVERGEMVALLGPNGAGKSTTLRMLTTLLQPTSGRAEVAGCDVVADPAGVRRRIGYIGQGNGAAHAQRVRDEVVNQARIYGLGRRDARQRADDLLDGLQLGAVAERVVSTLSGGQRRRLDVALGMVHAPELLFLDEPSTGLDPQNRANLQHEIERLRAEHGTTIVLTTHYLDEADALADRVVVIDHGSVIADDTPTRLKADLAGDRLELELLDPAHVGRVTDAVRGVGEVEQLDIDGTTVRARVRDGAESVPNLIVDLSARGITLRSVEVSRPTLDDVFLTLTGRSLRDGGPAEPDTDTDIDRPIELEHI